MLRVHRSASLAVWLRAGHSSYIEINLDLTNYSNPIVTFATRGTSSGYNNGILSYSVTGGVFTKAEINTASTSAYSHLNQLSVSQRSTWSMVRRM